MSKSILDPEFKYVPSSKTNIKATFDRIRREQKKAAKIQTVQEVREFNIVQYEKRYKG